MSIEDIIDILAIDLVGVVPDDENIIISTNKENQQLQITNPRQVRLIATLPNVFWENRFPNGFKRFGGFLSKMKKLFGIKPA